MINPFINNGTQFYISNTRPIYYTQAGYELLVFTPINGIRSIGDIGETYETVDYNMIGDIRYNKKLGKIGLSIPVETINIKSNGQNVLNALVKTTSAAAFKIVTPDNTTYYFTAECSGNVVNRGESSLVSSRKITLNVNSELIEI